MHRAYYSFSAFLAVFAGFLVFGIAFSAITESAAQPQTGTDSTHPSAEQSATQARSAPEAEVGQYVLKSQVPLVVLDVVVTDGKGHPVHGLKQTDFTVLEKGQEMKVESFDEHRIDQALPSAPPTARKPLPPNVFTNIPPTPNNGPLNVLLMDALNTQMGDQAYVHAQMLKYIGNIPAGTRIAIFGLSNHLYMLQGFTTNPAVLRAALNKKKALADRSTLLNTPEEDRDIELTERRLSDKQFDAEMGTQVTTLRTEYTLAAMEDLARYLSGIPGRKNLIWFSAAFPINIFPNGDLPDAFDVTADYKEQVKTACDLLLWAQVAVYPVDGRGLFSDTSDNASLHASPYNLVVSGGTYGGDIAKFFDQTTGEHATMNLMADQTGGKAFFNTNDLNTSVQEAINQGSNYYTLSYTPSNRRWDGSYRSVRVKLDQPGVDLSYHHGYFAEDPHAKSVRGTKGLPVTVMQGAMRRGGPGATEIIFDAHIVPGAGTDDTLPPANEPVDKKKMKPPYQHYAIRYFADIRHMAFAPTPDGKYHGSFECIAVLYNPEGEMLNSTTTRVNLNPAADRYQLMLQNGVGLRQEIAAPAKGEYFLRLGVHDLASGRVGAVEVPLAAIQPEAAPANPAPAGR